MNSAFVSGMKEDLGMYGNQLTTAITCWTVGYAVGQSGSSFSNLVDFALGRRTDPPFRSPEQPPPYSDFAPMVDPDAGARLGSLHPLLVQGDVLPGPVCRPILRRSRRSRLL